MLRAPETPGTYVIYVVLGRWADRAEVVVRSPSSRGQHSAQRRLRGLAPARSPASRTPGLGPGAPGVPSAGSNGARRPRRDRRQRDLLPPRHDREERPGARRGSRRPRTRTACHGFAHRRVFEQTPDEFRADVEESIEVIRRIVGERPLGYRAPAFSLNRDTVWAYGILADLGFRWDSSQYDSPRIPRRLQSIPASPYVLEEPDGGRLWEFPLAVSTSSVGRSRSAVAVTGASFPTGDRSALRRRGDDPAAALYVHPYEFDDVPLRPELGPDAAFRRRVAIAAGGFRANVGRARVARCLRYLSREFRLVTYREAFEALQGSDGDRTRTLSPQGVLV